MEESKMRYRLTIFFVLCFLSVFGQGDPVEVIADGDRNIDKAYRNSLKSENN